MVLNKDCVRDILLYVEKHCVYYDDKRRGRTMYEIRFAELIDCEELKPYDYDTIHYALEHLFKDEYIEGSISPQNAIHTFKIAHIKGLTLKGHELLDNIKSQAVWDTVKEKSERTEGCSLDVISAIARDTIIEYLQ